jgi:hypothetical protein
LRLEIELVPKPLWQKSLRRMLPRGRWENLRAQRIREKGWRCEICGEAGSVQLHEIWKYDDEKHVQTLLGFELLCVLCHSVKHFGRTQALAEEGKIDLKPIIAHFCRVNQCSYQDLKAHWKDVYERWKERSRHEWTQDLSLLTSFSVKYPQTARKLNI